MGQTSWSPETTCYPGKQVAEARKKTATRPCYYFKPGNSSGFKSQEKNGLHPETEILNFTMCLLWFRRAKLESRPSENMVSDYYHNLFSSEGNEQPMQNIPAGFPALLETQTLTLLKPFSKEEVKNTIFGMAPFKAQELMGCTQDSTRTCGK